MEKKFNDNLSEHNNVHRLLAYARSQLRAEEDAYTKLDDEKELSDKQLSRYKKNYQKLRKVARSLRSRNESLIKSISNIEREHAGKIDFMRQENQKISKNIQKKMRIILSTSIPLTIIFSLFFYELGSSFELTEKLTFFLVNMFSEPSNY